MLAMTFVYAVSHSRPMSTTDAHARLPRPEDQPTLGVEQTAQILGLSRAAAYNAVKAGQIPSITIGRRILVPTAALRRMLGLDATMEATGAP